MGNGFNAAEELDPLFSAEDQEPGGRSTLLHGSKGEDHRSDPETGGGNPGKEPWGAKLEVDEKRSNPSSS